MKYEVTENIHTEYLRMLVKFSIFYRVVVASKFGITEQVLKHLQGF